MSGDRADSADNPTLSLRVDTLRLRDVDALDERWPVAVSRIEIFADTLCVDGWVRLPGRALRIRARRIVARPAHGRIAVLDVSGGSAEPDFDPQAPSSRPRGTPAAPNGQPGQDGGAGQPGGTLCVLVDEVDGELGLAANGSRGGGSGRGSDGVQPATANGKDGRFSNARKEKGPFGGGILEHKRLGGLYVAWASGQAGGHAQPGGDAGAPGQPGPGGDGGQVRLRFTGAQSPTLVTAADGAAPGVAGQPAQAGAAGRPGKGGRNRMHVWGVIVGAHESFVGKGADSYVADYARRHKIAPCAASGKGGAAAGKVPPSPTAQPGQPGRLQVAPAGIDVAGTEFDLRFLQWLLACAERQAREGDADDARRRLDWLARLARASADGDADRAALARSAIRVRTALEDRAAAAPLG